MVNNKAKLVAAALALIIALVLLVSGTFAWFTVSSKSSLGGIQVAMEFTGEEWPFEVSLDGTNYWKDAKVDGRFTTNGGIEAVTVLRPISTPNGSQWYLPNYDSVGGVSGFRPVGLESVGSNLSLGGKLLPEGSNYLVYYDMWVRTLDKDTNYALKLSNPASGSKILDEETLYGTYVVSLPVRYSTGCALSDEGEDATCCVRLGFLVLDDNGTGTGSVGQFTVYEPNADKSAKKFGLNEQFGASSQLIYVAGTEENNGKTVGSYDIIEKPVDTLIPYTSGGAIEMGCLERVIQQYQSCWDEEQLATLRNTIPSSRNIATFGAFCVDNNGVADNDKYSLATVPHYDKNKSDSENKGIKIRVFLWLEGQDIDCWNEVRNGSIFANLEFKGTPLN